MKIDESTKENLKWLMGIAAGFLMVMMKFTIDNYVESNKRIELKVDKTFDFMVNHEALIKVISNEAERERKKVLDLQLAHERLETYIQITEQRRKEEHEAKSK